MSNYQGHKPRAFTSTEEMRLWVSDPRYKGGIYERDESKGPARVPFPRPSCLHHFQSRIEFMPTGRATDTIRFDCKFV